MNSNLPPAISTYADNWDNAYNFLVWSSLIAGIIMLGGMAYFILKYNRKSEADRTAYISHNQFLEFLWSFIPLVLFMGIFVWGWIIYHEQRTPPEGAMEVSVTAVQWRWDFEYKNGKKSTNEFFVPVGTPVKLIMTSADVIHSLYVPSFRMKQDVVPGRYTQAWFQAKETGVFQVFCTEFCGTSHSAMLAKVHVVDRPEFEKWLTGDADASMAPAERGKKLYTLKGCNACHSIDGSKVVGPTFKNVWGREEEISDGSKIKVDENYVAESVLNPQAKVVKGFPPSMPSFQGVVNEAELKALIEFLKTVK
jgi:cytochrome c oxidase subunit II